MKFKKFKPNDYVMVIKNGKVVREGLGLSVLYNDLTTSIMVAPSTAFVGAFAFDDVVTSDYESVCVQGVTTYMITDYNKAAKMLDFAYQPPIQTDDKIAEQMAQIMQEMGQHERQVISITHLPQIAALGTSHYKVEKEETASGTKSSMRLLTTDERIKEIAQMLSGSEVSDAAIQNAKQLLRL